jgi:hypothetical protein
MKKANPIARELAMHQMNSKELLRVTTCLVALLGIFHGMEADAKDFPRELRVGPDVLTLRGVGLVRQFLLIKVVAAALYVENSAPVEQVLSNVAKRVEMVSFRTIPASDFIREAESSLAENVPPATIAALRSRIDQLHAAYEDLKLGDHYALMYIPESGTRLELNGDNEGDDRRSGLRGGLFRDLVRPAAHAQNPQAAIDGQ